MARPQLTVVRAPASDPAGAAVGLRPLVLDRYRLRRRLGAGAFGTVWLAHDERLARPVAVKEVPLADPAEESGDGAGGREALAAARLSHPAIVMLYEAGAEDGRAYLVSELVRGETLAALIARGELSDRDVVRIGLVLCDALDHAHAHGVIHRDVKPSNVMVPDEPERGAGVAKLTDFGVAHVAGGELLTHPGDVVGTLAYMAPEQAEGRRAGPAADLYSLALVLYEALTGANPVRAAGAAATARRVGSPVASLGRRRRDLPPQLAAGLDRALRVLPADRGTVEELRRALADALSDVSDAGGTIATSSRDGRRAPRIGGLASRGLAGAGAGGLVAAALATLAVRPPLAPATGGVVAALLVALLPRLGWLLGGLVLAAWQATLQPGLAVLILLAVAGPPLLLLRAGRAWSTPALAPALGLLSLAGAFPALAAQAGSPWRRAAVGAIGFWWLALDELGFGRPLFYGTAPGSPVAAGLTGSVGGVLDAVGWLATSGELAAAGLWAVAAVVLPLLVRGRVLIADLVLGGAWATALVVGAGALGSELRGPVPYPGGRGAVPAAALAALLSVALARRANRAESDSFGVS